MHSIIRRIWIAVSLATWLAPVSIAAQQTPEAQLDSLVRMAESRNPRITAAQHRLSAARSRVQPAGAPMDPMLGLGLMNMPLLKPGFEEEMTMVALMVSQRIMAGGRLQRMKQAMEYEVATGDAVLQGERLRVRSEVLRAYYETAYFDRALEVIERQRTVLGAIATSAESRYRSGSGMQQDVFRARLEVTRLAEEATQMTEMRAGALAGLNGLLDQPADVPLPSPRIPGRVARMAVASDPASITFTSAALGSRVTNSPLPPLNDLMQRALQLSPMIREKSAMIDAAAAREEIARKAHLPDFDVSFQYGVRVDKPDMFSLQLSAPLAIRRRSNQGLLAAAAASEVSASRADLAAVAADVRTMVAKLYAELEQARSQLGLYQKAIIPQGIAAAESATLGFTSGRNDLGSLLEARSTLVQYETAYQRLIADFAERLAELEAVVGGEVVVR